jgi:hypothetical protein
MDVVIAQLLEQLKSIREEAAARDETARAEAAAARAEAAARDAVLRAELAAIRAGAAETPLSPSYASVGDDALVTLDAIGRIYSAPEPPVGASAAERAPVATSSDLARLRACSSERDLVAEITPLLQEARGFGEAGAGAAAAADPCPRVLVNSESTPWLDALHAPLPPDQLKRPDLFSTWAPFWSGRLVPKRGAVGKLAARALQLDGCTREFYEAKLGVGELTPADFGQLVDYHSRVRGAVRGVLFNARVFWLYDSRRSHPVSLTKGEWGAPGSRAALRAFFDAAAEPPLVPLLRFLCRALGVVPHRVIVGSGVEPAAGDASARASAFLGAGGSARVFCVARRGAAGEAAELHALKASSTLSLAELKYEFQTLQLATAAGAPVVPAVADSLACFVDDGAYRGGGFLLHDVCARAAVDSPARCAAAFAALGALHTAGFAHGDARLPNLLARKSGGAGAELVWIDLRAAAAGEFADALASAQRTDGRTLAASILGAAPGDALPAPVAAALVTVPEGGDAAYAALAAAVWAAFGAVG